MNKIASCITYSYSGISVSVYRDTTRSYVNLRAKLPCRDARDFESGGAARRDGGSRRSKVVPELTARFPGTAKRKGREDRADRVGRGREFRRCVDVCAWHVALATSCVPSPSPGDDADKWRVAPFGHATPNWRYRDVTCCASLVYMSLADFSVHAMAWREGVVLSNVRVSACNPPCF